MLNMFQLLFSIIGQVRVELHINVVFHSCLHYNTDKKDASHGSSKI